MKSNFLQTAKPEAEQKFIPLAASSRKSWHLARRRQTAAALNPMAGSAGSAEFAALISAGERLAWTDVSGDIEPVQAAALLELQPKGAGGGVEART
jgi:hypothetical protein